MLFGREVARREIREDGIEELVWEGKDGRDGRRSERGRVGNGLRREARDGRRIGSEGE
jgi:hypothetical protein